jgi:hypothetical protein
MEQDSVLMTLLKFVALIGLIVLAAYITGNLDKLREMLDIVYMEVIGFYTKAKEAFATIKF